MQAVVIDGFAARPKLMRVDDPAPPPDGVVLRVEATGVCRSDWHGWMGHDDGITLPHVPGHEMAGVVEAVGSDVRRWRIGDRVTVPFVVACGTCPECQAGHQQVCDDQFQPGFTHWGSFAEYVAIPRADMNLIALPETMEFVTAASLGCRFATSFRAVVDQGRTAAGHWVAVHGCGGVGLSAIMIARGIGAQVVAVDVSDKALDHARAVGATATINAASTQDVVSAVRDVTGGGAHVSLDALGHPTTAFNSVSNLRKRGKHIQVGLLLADQSTPPLPMDQVIAQELEILGSHGMQAHRYAAMLNMIEAGAVRPDQLVARQISLADSIEALVTLDTSPGPGLTVISSFD